MSFSLNKATLIGFIGKDPETKTTPSNLSITSFSIATTNSYKGKDGNYVNETTWHNITCFNLSDYFKENLKKGSKIYLEGRIQNDEYTDKDGNKKRSTKIISEKIIPLDKAEHERQQQESQTEPGAGLNPPGMSEQEQDSLPF